MYLLQDIKNKIEEIFLETTTLEEMQRAWNSDDACDKAINDPGLQFSQECLIQELREELIDLMEEYIGDKK